MYEEANKSELLKGKEIEIIELPIDQEFWKPFDKDTSKNLLNIASDKKVIAFGAENFLKNTRKGFNILVEVIKRLKKEKKFEFETIIFGETKNLNQFENLSFKSVPLKGIAASRELPWPRSKTKKIENFRKK